MCRSSSTIALKDFSGFFLPNLAGIILIWPSLIIVQMVMVHCIFRSHRLKIDETTRHSAVVFGM